MSEHDKDNARPSGAEEPKNEGPHSVSARQSGFHPVKYVREELAARGWSEEDFIRKVAAYDYSITYLATELFFAIGDDPNGRMGHLVESFGAVFGVSPELFTNLEQSWLRSITGGSDAERAVQNDASSGPQATETIEPFQSPAQTEDR